MKKQAFYITILTLSVLIMVASCGGGSSSGTLGERGEPSGASTYSATALFPFGFFGTDGKGTLWIFANNSNAALYFKDATRAYQLTRVGVTDSWTSQPGDLAFDIEITSGAEGYVRFSNPDSWPSRYSYNISDTVLIISNTTHGTKKYNKFVGTFSIQ